MKELRLIYKRNVKGIKYIGLIFKVKINSTILKQKMRLMSIYTFENFRKKNLEIIINQFILLFFINLQYVHFNL